MLDQMFDLSEAWNTDNEIRHFGPTFQLEVNYCSCLWCSSFLQEGELPGKRVLGKTVEFFKNCIMTLLHSLSASDQSPLAVRSLRTGS